ncbi:MAG: translocation/assembly module TamB domain-containing protein, partial [bacterium]
SFTADLVAVRFSLWEAINGKLGFANIQLIKPKIILYTETFQKSTTELAPRLKPRFTLNWFQIEDATFELHHQNKIYPFSAMDLAGSLNYDGDIPRLQLGIRKCSGIFSGFIIKELRGSLRIDNKQIELKNLRITGNNIQLIAEGNVTGYQLYNPSINIKVSSSKLPIQKLLELYPTAINFPLTGTARLQAEIHGPLNELTGSGELMIPEGKLGTIPYTGLLTSFTATTGTIKLNQGKATIFGGQISAAGEMNISQLSNPIISELQVKPEVPPTPSSSNRDTTKKPEPAASKSAAKRSISSQTTEQKIPISDSPKLKFKFMITAENVAVDKFPNAANLVAGTISGNIQLAGILNNPESWSGSGKMQWSNGKYQSVPITIARSEIGIDKGILSIQNLQLENQDMQATGTGFIRLPSTDSHLQFTLVAHRFDSINSILFTAHETEPKTTPAPILSGSGTAEIVLDGPIRDPHWSGKFSVTNGTFASLRFAVLQGQIVSPSADKTVTQSSDLTLHWENLQWGEGWNLNGDAKLRVYAQQKKAQLISATFTSGKSVIATAGDLDFAAKRFQLTYSGKNLVLADFPQLQKAIPNLSATLDLEGTISGLFSAPVINGRMATSSLTANKSRPKSELPKLTGTFAYTGTLRQTQIYVSGAGFQVQGMIQVADIEPTIQLQVAAQSGNLNLITAAMGLPNTFESGTITGAATVSGKISNLAATGNFSQIEIITPESTNKTILVNGTYTSKITKKSGILQISTGALRSSTLNQTKTKNGKSTGENQLFGLDAIKGDWNWNESGQFTGNIYANKGIIGSIPLTNFTATGKFQSGIFEVTDCRFATGNGTLALNGSVNWNQKPFTYQLTSRAQNIQLQPIIRAIKGLEQFNDNTGILNAILTLNGKGDQTTSFNGKGNLSLTQISFFNRNIDSLSANIEIAGESLKITEAELKGNNTIASLSGWIDKNQKLNITAKGNTADLKSWVPQMKGAAGFDLNWTNTLQKPVLTCYLESSSGGYGRFAWDKARVTVKLTDKFLGSIDFRGERMRLGTQRFDLATAILKLDDPNIELTNFTATQKDGSSQAQGKANLNTGDISITLDGKKLDFMNLLFGGTQAPWWETGEVNLHAEFNGNYKQHYATTKIDPLLVVSKQKINGNPKYTLRNQQALIVQWNNDRITVPKIKVADNTGSFTIGGNIQLTPDYHIKYYDMALEGNNVSWPVLRGLDATYNPQLTLRGDTTNIKWSGDFPITKAEINGPILFAPTPSNIPKLPVVRPPAYPVNLDLKFHANEKLHLKTPMVDVDGLGWIKLEGLANEPKISYEFRAVSGSVLFRGYKFQITKADAKPRESNSFNPVMDLFAQKKIRFTDVYLRFYGTLQNYEITLTSDPPMEQSDIMALLATGKTTEELRNATAAGSEKFAYGLAAGYVGEELINTIGVPIFKTIGLDRIGVDYDNTINPTEPRVKIEKDITKRVTASYSMGLTKSADPQAKLELGLGRNLSLIGSVGTNSLTQEATGAVDLELRFRTK